MKKILFVINTLGVGGAERMVIDDINELLRKEAAEVFLLTLMPETTQSLAGELQLSKDRWKTIPFKRWYDILAWISVVRYFRSLKPDGIYSNLWYANIVSMLAGFFVGQKNIVIFEQNVYDATKSRKSFFLDRILQTTAHRIVAVSNVVKDSLLRHGISEKKIEVIYNGVDIHRFELSTSPASMLPNMSENFSFLFVGRLIPQKGIDVLVRAFAEVPDSVLYIVGKGTEERSLKALALSLGISKRVNFLGVREDVVALMRVCNCFVFPSRYEGFSLVLLEAMAAGMPLVVTNFKAGSEIVIDNVNGLVVAIDDAKALARSCRRIREDGDLRSRLAQEARMTANRFSVEEHVQKLLALLE